ncbi:hypothetical protein [Deinococcus planocerae]|uniref:hypothetical protein n=1 Tax=Deinococcus planocerae TaxID=1737569 RepID=UPI000C7F5A73|nr:hypothetical protein [Deinococcus planocerae]
MNAREWLEQATMGMPEAVRDRVRAETLAHLEDAGVGEGEDVRDVLGSPERMERELGRLYLPPREIGVLRRDPSYLSAAGYGLLVLLTYVAPFFLLFSTFHSLRFDLELPQARLLSQVALSLLWSWLIALLLTRGLGSERRRLWHGALGFATWLGWYGLDSLVGSLGEGPLDRWSVVGLALPLCGACFFLWKAWRDDGRLRRTLALLDLSEDRA